MMILNLENDFNSLCALLATYQNIWRPEVMNSYPKSLEAYPIKWVEYLKSLSDEKQWLIDAGIDHEGVELKDLKDLLQNLKKNSAFLKLNYQDIKFNDADYFKMKDKKRHEIKLITGLLSENPQSATKCIDIGGGIGHLSRTLVKKLNKESTIIELDPNFVRIGKQVNDKLNINNITYCGQAFNKNGHYHLSNKEMTFGLHACGDLSSDIIEYTAKNKLQAILSFGCCYFKTPFSTYQFLSNKGKDSGLKLSKYSLTLASRAHTGLSKEAFLKKKKVKQFRYAFHLFLYHHLGITEFKEVGESKFSLYQGEFSDYANSKLEYLNLEKINSRELNKFFDKKEVIETIDSMFCANIIRWQFGRAIEKLILLDRALYLKENNYEIKMGELFDEKISPRNVAILGSKLPQK